MLKGDIAPMTVTVANLKTPRVNPDWATLPLFDRTGWTKVRFGEVVRVLKEQVDPASGDVERYVAGEHMDSESVHIRRWGTVGDGYLGPAFIRRFRKGQVLYGSRRTYLKKVAVAEWDGVTANTTFVLQAVEGRLLQELLPWLMLSERFTKHSIQESKGSTNPYINWPDIAKFEFDLPPIDRQRRIAEVLCVVRGNGNRSLCGRAGIVETMPDGCFYPDLLIRLRFADDRLLPAFAVLQWNESKCHTRLLSMAKSTNGIWKINGKDIRSHRLAVPPIAKQERFLDGLTEKTALIEALRSSLAFVSALRLEVANAI